MILNVFSLEGKVAVVTGCDTGLGQGMALGLAQAGHDTAGINIVEPVETTRQTTAQGCRFLSLTVDPRKIDGIPGLLDRVVTKFGHIDTLVDSTGLIRRKDALEFSEIDWDGVMDLSIKSVFFMSQTVAKHSITQGNGSEITNIAPMLSSQSGIRIPSYIIPESGVMDVTRLMANEWAKRNINVNAIAPGCMVTSSTQQLRADEQHSAEVLDRILAGRWGLSSGLIGLVALLVSSASDYVDGYTAVIDGGWLTR